MSTCDKAEALRDYAFDELPAGDRRAMEQHIGACAECGAELDQLRLTTAALRILPDLEIPQRIAFVSDKVFEPSPVARWFGGLWNSAARLGFVSALTVACALIVFAYHRPLEIRTVVQAAPVSTDVTKQVNDAVAKAVAKVHADDTQFAKFAIEAADRRHEKDRRAFIEAVSVLQQLQNTTTLLASADRPQTEAGQ